MNDLEQHQNWNKQANQKYLDALDVCLVVLLFTNSGRTKLLQDFGARCYTSVQPFRLQMPLLLLLFYKNQDLHSDTVVM